MDLACEKTEKRLEGAIITYFLGAKKQKPLWNLKTEQIHQILQKAKAIQRLENTESWALDMFCRLFDNLGTFQSFGLAGTYHPLISNTDSRKRKEESISGALKTLLHKRIFYFSRRPLHHCVAKQEQTENPSKVKQ